MNPERFLGFGRARDHSLETAVLVLVVVVVVVVKFVTVLVAAEGGVAEVPIKTEHCCKLEMSPCKIYEHWKW